MIELIITDFDGTLCDTFDAHCSSYKEAFNKCGCLFDETQYRKLFGLCWGDIAPKMNVPINLVKTIHDSKLKLYKKKVNRIHLNCGLLHEIIMYHNLGVKTAIATNGDVDSIKNILRYFGITKHFDMIVGSNEVSKPKPDPEIFNLIMREFGATPENTYIYEDSESGFEAAKLSGANLIDSRNIWYC